jgi:hypothetical protein
VSAMIGCRRPLTDSPFPSPHPRSHHRIGGHGVGCFELAAATRLARLPRRRGCPASSGAFGSPSAGDTSGRRPSPRCS